MSSDQSAKTLKERKFIEFFVRYVWSAYRLCVKRHITKRCVRCSISTHCTPLDDNGVCGFCKEDHEKKTDTVTPEKQKEMENTLHSVLMEAAGKGEWKYDALVFFSGGKDSSYLLHKLRKEYPRLRILAISVDNSFMSPVALENIEQVIRKIDVDHVVCRPHARIYEKLFRHAFTHSSAKGSAEAIDVLDGEFRFDFGRHLAANLGIPLIIIGFSRAQVSAYMGSLQFEAERAFEESARTKASIYNLNDLPLSKEELEYWWDGTRYQKEKIARIIYPLVVWNYSEEYLMEQVVQLGLLSKQNVSPAVTNHLLIPLMALADIALLGYSSWELEFAQMIRHGKADRIYWRNMFELIEYAAKTGRFIGRSVDEMLSRLKLTREEIGLPSK